MWKTIGPIAAAAAAGALLISGATFADGHHKDAKPQVKPYVVHGVYETGNVGQILGTSTIQIKTPNGNVTLYVTGTTNLHLQASGTAASMLAAITSQHMYITARVEKVQGKLTALSLNARVNAEKKPTKKDAKDPKNHARQGVKSGVKRGR